MIWKITLPCNKAYTLQNVPNNYSELIASILHKIHHSPVQGTFSLKYIDSDEDLVNLNNNEDFETAVFTGRKEKLHTIQILVINNQSLREM